MYKLKMSYNNEIAEENEEEEEEVLSITVLNRQTNGPHPDCDLEFDAVLTPPREEDEEDSEENLDLVQTHPLELGIFNFIDNNPYSIFYNNMYNIIDPRTISYYQDDQDNIIQEINLDDDLVMPMPCASCYRFECNC